MEILREARLQENQVLIISSVLQQTNDYEDAEPHTTTTSSRSSNSMLEKMILEMGRMMPGGPGCSEGQYMMMGYSPVDNDDDPEARPGSSSAQSVPSSFVRTSSSCCHHYYYLSTASSSCDGDDDDDDDDEDDNDKHSNRITTTRCIPNINRPRSEMPTIIKLFTTRSNRQMSF